MIEPSDKITTRRRFPVCIIASLSSKSAYSFSFSEHAEPVEITGKGVEVLKRISS
jgi:hypothetical protein